VDGIQNFYIKLNDSNNNQDIFDIENNIEHFQSSHIEVSFFNLFLLFTIEEWK